MNGDVAAALTGGVPTTDELAAVEASELYAELERTSTDWLRRHADLLAPYASRWVADPMHQWSRRWEYPFVARAITESGARTVLDAGAGFTFFPTYLAARGISVTCVDTDDHTQLYRRASDSELITFRQGDLRELPFADGEVDAAYSISVLEHTGGFERIVDELRRVLAHGGLLVVTFDISLDGLADIPIARGEELIAKLWESFEPVDAPRNLHRLAGRPDLLTTGHAASVDPTRLPWKSPFLSLAKSALHHRRLPLGRMKQLTCYGGIFRKP